MRSQVTIQVRGPQRRGMFAHPLAREIGLVLVIKLVLLVCGFWLLFGPETRPQLTPDGILDHLSSAAAPVAGGFTTSGDSND